MKNFFKFIRSDKIIYFGFLFSAVLIIICIIGVASIFSFLPPFLPIYNKLPWGYARVGGKAEIFIPIGITFLIYLMNIFLCRYVHTRILLLGRILAATAFLVCLSLFIYIIQIVLLVH